MRGGRMLGQGSYGCVFAPGFQCASHGSDSTHVLSRNKKTVSKVQVDNETSQNEIAIGKILSTIPENTAYFQVLQESCPVFLEQLRDEDVKQCEVGLSSSTTDSSNKMLMLTLPFIEGKHPLEWLRTKHNPISHFQKLILHLGEGLVKLQSAGIVHRDLKNDNILVTPSGKGILLDFGLGMDMNKDTWATHVFYAPDYELWPPELQLYHEPEITDKHVQEIVFHTVRPLSLLLDKPFLEKYRQLLTMSLQRWQSMMRREKREKVQHRIKQLWQSWDVYALSFWILNLLTILRTEGHLEESPDFYKLLEVALQGLHPTQRLNATEFVALLKRI